MPTLAYAQDANPPTLGGSASGAAGGDGGVLALFALLLGMGVLIGITVKMLDLQKKREEEAVHVQAKISDALLLDSALAMLPVTVTAHIGFWRGSPVIVDVSGRVTRPDQREAVMRLVNRELARIRQDYRLVDRILVAPEVLTRAA